MAYAKRNSVIRGSISRDKGDRWTHSERLYPVNFVSRKRAVSWLLRKLEREHPGCQEYDAEIIDD